MVGVFDEKRGKNWTIFVKWDIILGFVRCISIVKVLNCYQHCNMYYADSVSAKRKGKIWTRKK